jgi:hypothetical protein
MWCENEFALIELGDSRRNARLIELSTQILRHPQASLNHACETLAATKAAYRLFGNHSVTADKILEPHRQMTARRMGEHSLVLAVQDTVTLNYNSMQETEGLGFIGSRSKNGLRGLLLHHTLAYTPDGVPLGVLTQEIWARPFVKGVTTSDCKAQRFSEKETYRWLRAAEAARNLTPEGTDVVTVCDRGGDIYELMHGAEKAGIFFLIRASINRAIDPEFSESEGGGDTLYDHIAEQAPAATFDLEVIDEKTLKPTVKKVDVRFGTVALRRPKRPSSAGFVDLPGRLDVSVVLVSEARPSAEKKALSWTLLTNMSVESLAEAVEKVHWYRIRWQIELYHKVLKSGFRIEACRLGHADKLKRFISLVGILACRIQQITMESRKAAPIPASEVLSSAEWSALRAVTEEHTKKPISRDATAKEALRMIARLGGFMGRKSDGDPGLTTVWRGWVRLQDLALAWTLQTEERCGY